MKIVDWFKGEAARAEQALDAVASEQESELATGRAIARMERRFEAMAADGTVDAGEMAELLASLRALGADTSRIAAAWARTDGVSAPSRSALGDEIRAVLSGARADARDSAADLSFRVQVAANDYTHSQDAASRLMKNEHDAYMTVIRNIAG